jgi:hypothetical protein
MQTTEDIDKTNGTLRDRQVAFPVVSGCGYGHEKDRACNPNRTLSKKRSKWI